jgi:hypothetical protein
VALAVPPSFYRTRLPLMASGAATARRVANGSLAAAAPPAVKLCKCRRSRDMDDTLADRPPQRSTFLRHYRMYRDGDSSANISTGLTRARRRNERQQNGFACAHHNKCLGLWQRRGIVQVEERLITITDRIAPRRIGTAGIIRTAPTLTREHFLGIRRTILCGTMARACVLRQGDGAVELLSRQSETSACPASQLATGALIKAFSWGTAPLRRELQFCAMLFKSVLAACRSAVSKPSEN